ncbi:MAG: helix-turn-helix transcriptional regulator [Clostridiales bacterium]|nr:helix-turn-helix transcriptional regulator [Clostridiales bacterium]
MLNHNNTIKMRNTSGSDSLKHIKKLLEEQHGEEVFNKAMKVAEIERDILDSLTLYRKQHKMTQKQLAEKIDTRPQQVSKYERAEQTPSLSAILKICEALGLELSLKSKENNEVIFHS